jgi:hypothetical protein
MGGMRESKRPQSRHLMMVATRPTAVSAGSLKLTLADLNSRRPE